jgi:uncharacterized protein (TIGR03067 family)
MRHLFTAIFMLALLPVLGGAETDTNAEDREKLQGDWAVVSFIADGIKAEDDNAQSLFRTVKGNEYTVYLFDKKLATGTFKIDAAKKPKAIDFFPSNLAGKSMLGIYEIDGNTLKTCYAPPGKERPTEFTSTKGSERTLTIWEKEKK